MTVIAAIAVGIVAKVVAKKMGDVKNDLLARYKSSGLKSAEKKQTDVERAQAYDNARQSLLGDFGSSPVAGCRDCLVAAKAQRRAERLDLVNRAMLVCPDHTAEAVELRQLTDEVENMRCAKHVYTANDNNSPDDLKDPPPGFKKLTKEEMEAELAKMGLDEEMLSPKNSNFRAAVYFKDPAVWGDNPQPAAVVAFRGSTPEKEDWDNNFAQNENKDAPYYRRAVEIGDALRTNGANAQIVGHSLGGGLASAAQGASGLPASTYNSAGLNPQTVPRYLKDLSEDVRNAEKDKIKAFRIEGEVLTKTQEDSMLSTLGLTQKAVGEKIEIKPAHDREYFEKNVKSEANSDYDTYLHGMDEVIASTEKQKEADESALKGCLQGKGTDSAVPLRLG